MVLGLFGFGLFRVIRAIRFIRVLKVTVSGLFGQLRLFGLRITFPLAFCVSCALEGGKAMQARAIEGQYRMGVCVRV